MSSKTVTLKVNGGDVPLSFFVQTFFDRVIDGMVGALEATCPVETLTLESEADAITMTVNGAPVAMNEFVHHIVHNTALGMVTSLRGVDNVRSFTISIAAGK
jgi:hypothetical protein